MCAFEIMTIKVAAITHMFYGYCNGTSATTKLMVKKAIRILSKFNQSFIKTLHYLWPCIIIKKYKILMQCINDTC